MHKANEAAYEADLANKATDATEADKAKATEADKANEAEADDADEANGLMIQQG